MAGLGFVWLQVRQVQKQLKLQNYAEYTRRYSEIIFKLPEEVNGDDFSLDERDDRKEIRRVFRAFFDLCFEEYDLSNRGLIDKESWKVWKGGIKTAMDRPAFKQAWEIVRDSSGFGNEFNKFIKMLSKP